jgi:hypothetical protein
MLANLTLFLVGNLLSQESRRLLLVTLRSDKGTHYQFRLAVYQRPGVQMGIVLSDVLGSGCRLPQRGGAVLARRHVRLDPPGAPRPIRSSSVRALARRPRTWARRTPIGSFSLTFRNVLTGRVRFTGHAAARARPGPSSASACRARRWPVSMTVIVAPSARCRGAPGHATPTAAECPR